MSDQTANAGSSEEDTSGKQKQKEQTGENNQQNNDDNFEDLWHDPDESSEQTPQQKTPQQTQPANIEQKPNVDEAFNTYIEGLDLTKGIDLAKVSDELNQGNTESLGNAFSVIAAKTYRQAMVDMSKIIDQKVAAGVKAAVTQSSNVAQGDMAVRHMNNALDFTKNPAIAPVASAVLAQLIKKGKSTEDAVEGVRKFFQNTSKISAKALGLQKAPQGRPGNQPFSGAVNIDDDEDAEVDWIETLGV